VSSISQEYQEMFKITTSKETPTSITKNTITASELKKVTAQFNGRNLQRQAQMLSRLELVVPLMQQAV